MVVQSVLTTAMFIKALFKWLNTTSIAHNKDASNSPDCLAVMDWTFILYL